MECTYSASSRQFRKGGGAVAGKLGRQDGGGEPVSCFGMIHEHRMA